MEETPVAPPRIPARGASHEGMRRLGVWIGLGGHVTLIGTNLVWGVGDATAWRDGGLIWLLLAHSLGALAILGAPVLVVVGWIKSARAPTPGRSRRVIEWVVVTLGALAVTPLVVVVIAWATS